MESRQRWCKPKAKRKPWRPAKDAPGYGSSRTASNSMMRPHGSTVVSPFVFTSRKIGCSTRRIGRYPSCFIRSKQAAIVSPSATVNRFFFIPFGVRSFPGQTTGAPPSFPLLFCPKKRSRILFVRLSASFAHIFGTARTAPSPCTFRFFSARPDDGRCLPFSTRRQAILSIRNAPWRSPLFRAACLYLN